MFHLSKSAEHDNHFPGRPSRLSLSEFNFGKGYKSAFRGLVSTTTLVGVLSTIGVVPFPDLDYFDLKPCDQRRQNCFAFGVNQLLERVPSFSSYGHPFRI